MERKIKIKSRDVSVFYKDFKALHEINTVSYTHLDVYKRQPLPSSMWITAIGFLLPTAVFCAGLFATAVPGVIMPGLL